ncbi:MAG: PAS domain S-box protein [Rhodocyclaceae bacterium]|nr:PAS domain S-box protein [Rhodocyclaceae bacterium]
MSLNQRTKHAIFAFLTLLLSQVSLAFSEPDLVSIQSETTWQRVNGYTVTLYDPTNKLQIDDVTQASARDKFDSMPLDFIDAGTYWIHLRVHNHEDKAVVRWMDTNNRFLPEVEVFSPQPDGQYQRQLASASKSFSSRPLPFANFVFQLDIPALQTVDIYIRANTLGILRHSLELNLWEPEAYRTHIRNVEVQWFFFLGMSIGLALFNLFLYFSIRDSSYLLYFGMVLAQLWRTSDNGVAYEYFWPNSPFFEQVLSRGLSIIAVMTLTHFFVCRFIELPRLRPLQFRRLTTGLLVICLLVIFLISGARLNDVLPLSAFHVSQRLFVLIVVAYCLSILAILVKWTWSGNKRAKALLTAFSPLLILTGLIVPGLYFLKISFNWTIPPTMLGSGLTMILMAIALADRFEEARQAKETAQRELVDGLHSKERELEARVVQRTEDLSQASLAFQSVLENAQDAVVLTDQDGRITNWNREAESTFGWTKAEAIGSNLAQLIFPPHIHYQIASVLARHQSNQRDSARRESIAVRHDGTEFPIELSSTLINVGGNREFSFFIRDITQRRKADTEIAESLAKQSELADLKSRFVAMASHEFRTPLATILSSSELLSNYSDRLNDAERKRHFSKVDGAVHHMSSMLEDVLLIGKSDAGLPQFHPAPLDLRALCETIVAEVGLGRLNEEKNKHSIVLRMTENSIDAAFDERWLRHLFTNLLSNAIRYSPDGAPYFLTCLFVQTKSNFKSPTKELDYRKRIYRACSNRFSAPATPGKYPALD